MSKPRMTPAQARATDPSRTAFVAASAGTGKTHVLTARVLRLMLTGTPPDAILCLTFTKAAAAEMVSRIFTELGHWTRLSDTDLIAEIERRTEETADRAMLERARRLFLEVLDLEGGLKIQTFHSFCQSLLGRFPLEAGLLPGFDAVEEAEAADVMAAARDSMLSQTRTAGGRALRTALEDVALRVSETSFADVMRQLAFSQATLARALIFYGSPAGLFSALARALEVEPTATPEALIEEAVQPGRYDEMGLTRLMKAFEVGSKTEERAAPHIRAFLTADDTAGRAKALDAYRDVFLTKDGAPRKTVATVKTLKADPGLELVVFDEQQRLAALADRLTRLEAYRATRALLSLGIAQLDAYRDLKDAKGLVDFDDMIKSAQNLLVTPEIAPWILYKLDSGLDHILVDEAQDTNAAQWQVIEALSEEFFVGVGARSETRSLFAVGDAKQSIFSFQHADPRELEAAEDRILARARAAQMDADHIELDRSFRSGEAVLSLVDATFAPDSGPVRGLGRLVGPLKHAFTRSDVGGSVDLWPLELPLPDPENEEGEWVPPTTNQRRPSAEERTANKLARHIADQIDTAELKSHGRSVQAGDILILVRRRTKFVDLISKALKARGVAVAGRDRMLLTSELVVKDLMALGEWVLQTADDLALAAVLKSPLIGLSEDALFDLAYERSGTLWQALQGAALSDPVFKQAASLLSGWLRQVDKSDPYQFYASLLDSQSLRTAFAERLGEDCYDPVDAFLAEAAAYGRTRTPSLRGFLTSLARAGKTLKREFDFSANEVRIMTVHSAKGLQAPIVILADTVSLPDTAQDARLRPFTPEDGGADLLLWTSPVKNLPLVDRLKSDLKARQMEEYARLLYVALTRAEDHLIVVGWQGKTKMPESCWYQWVAAGLDRLKVEDLETGHRRYSLPFTRQLAAGRPAQASQDLHRVPPPPWLMDGASPAEPSPPRPLMPSRPDPEDPPARSPLAVLDPASHRGHDTGSGIRQAMAKGRIIHDLLDMLPGIPQVDRADVLARYLARPSLGLSSTDQIKVKDQVWRLLTDSQFAALFSEQSRGEVSLSGLIADFGRQEILAAQIDRIVMTDTLVQIVDYKTNQVPPGDVGDVDRVYLEQMGLYRSALARLYPDRPVQAALLWTETGTLMPLPDHVLEAALQRRKERLTRL